MIERNIFIGIIEYKSKEGYWYNYCSLDKKTGHIFTANKIEDLTSRFIKEYGKDDAYQIFQEQVTYNVPDKDTEVIKKALNGCPQDLSGLSKKEKANFKNTLDSKLRNI